MKHIIVISFSLTLWCQIVCSQTAVKSTFLRVENSTVSLHSSDIDESLKTLLNVPEDYEFRLKTFKYTNIPAVEEDNLGYVHERYAQYLNDLLITHSDIRVHYFNDILVSINGEYIDAASVDLSVVISEATAIQQAVDYIKNMQKTEMDSNWQGIIVYDTTISFYSDSEIVICRNNMDMQDTNFYVAYKIAVFAQNPYSHDEVYVDAKTGNILAVNTMISNAVGTAHTFYSDVQTISCEQCGVQYCLRDDSRGIETYNLKNYSFNETNLATDFVSNNTTWILPYAKDSGALDAHWGTMMVYDYFKNVHGRNSYDNNHGIIKNYIHIRRNPYESYLYANWQRHFQSFYYSDGDGVTMDILTSLDIVGHEFGHAICEYTADLESSGESGSIYEGISDIWGACLKNYVNTNYGTNKSLWLFAEEIVLNPAYNCFRDMETPKSSSASEGCSPNTYKGQCWNHLDYSPMHKNSTVLSHWFYLLCEGKTNGINDNNHIYNVTGIPIDKAEQIVYRALAYYMTQGTDFSMMRTYTIQAAMDIYGCSSPEVISATNAWYAVGVGSEHPFVAIATSPLSIISNTTWGNSNHLLSVPVTVEAGSTLTITGTVYCTPSASIMVKSGAKLVLDGCTLTGACDELWQGITVLGNDNAPQEDAFQGVVELIDNASIQDAICGIYVGSKIPIPIPEPYPGHVKPRMKYLCGGIIRAESASFLNNKQTVYFAPYSDQFYGGKYNTSYFKNCTFELNNNAFFAKAGKAQVELQGVDNISFTNCNFADYRTKTSTDDYTIGIYANASSIRVGNLPILVPHFNIGVCSFSGFNQAIFINGANTNSSRIYSGGFTDNHIAIEAHSVQDFRVGNCQFQLTPTTHFVEHIGVYLKNTSLYQIENNHFEGQPQTDGAIGIVADNTGTMNNFVKSNTFTNLCAGTSAIGTNGNGENATESQGLVYQCNKFATNNKDIWVKTNSQIRYRQFGADIDKATGNVFNNQDPFPSEWNIYYESGICSLAYYHIGSLSQTPAYVHKPYNNVTCIGNMTSDYCCISYGYGGNNYYSTWCMPMDLEELENRYMELVEPYGKGYGGKDSAGNFINWKDTANGGSSRYTLDEQLTELKQQIDFLCYAALEILVNDTAGLDIALYHIWLERFGTIEADYLLVDSYLTLGEYAQAATLLNVMPSKFPTLNLGIHQNYLEYSMVVQEYSILGEEQEIPPHLISEVIRLSSIANIAGSKAYSLGELMFSDWAEYYPQDISYPSCICAGSSPSQKSASANDNNFEENPPNTSSSLAKIKTEIILQPNPTHGELTIAADNFSIQDLIVYDIVGKEIMRVSAINSPQTTLYVASLHAGIYFLKIISEDGTPYTKKFVKH